MNKPLARALASAALLLVPRLVDESRSPNAHRPDFLGAITGTTGLLALVYGLLRAADHDWTETGVVTAIGGGQMIQGGGSLFGAIGVSGAPGGDADDVCAAAGIKAIADDLEF